MIVNYNQKEKIQNLVKFQKDSRKNILDVMQSFAESTNSIDLDSVNETIRFLEDLKASLELCNTNISLSERLLKELDSKTQTAEQVKETETVDNKTQEEAKSEEQDKKAETKTIENETQTENMDSKESNSNIQNNKETESKEQAKKEIKSEEQSNNTTSKKKYKDNTLIISETSGKVILPYKVSELEEELKNSNGQYNDIDEIITTKYTLPISLYKNPFIARFRESYKLMRHKEKSSIKEAFDLGLELMTNYNLHPAIISACKNLDELDIYLDYLENGETDKFKIFKIVFKIAPTIVK